MATKTDQIYRDAARRAHRVLGAYLVQCAWARGAECVVVQRKGLFRYLGLEARMETVRLEWLKEDLDEAFPHANVLTRTPNKRSRSRPFYSIYLSRRPFPADYSWPSLTDAQRAEKLTEAGFPTTVVDLPSETDMLYRVSKLVHGLSDHSDFRA